MTNLKRVLMAYCSAMAVARLGYSASGALLPAETEESEEAAYQKFVKLEAKMKEYLKKAVVAVAKLNLGEESDYRNLNVSEKCLNIVGQMKTALNNMDLWPFETPLHLSVRSKPVESVLRNLVPEAVSKNYKLSIVPKATIEARRLGWLFILVLDATGLPGRLLVGTSSSMGGYRQCLNIGDPEQDVFGIENSPPTKGQYCVVNVRIPLPPRPKFIFARNKLFPNKNVTTNSNLMKKFERLFINLYDNAYTFGLCVPYQCSVDDISAAFHYASGDSGLKTSIESCEIKEDVRLDKLQTFIVICAVLISGLCVVLSIVDEIRRYRHSNEYDLEKTRSGYFNDIIGAYSIRRNFARLVKTKQLEDRTFECLNGIRTMAMFWVILGHSYNLHGRTVLGNTLFIRDMISNIFFQVIANGFLAVVTFLFIGSTLISYGVVKSYDCRRKFNPLTIAARRVFRLLPSMFLAMGVVFLYPLLGSGPTFKTMTSFYYERCYANWWMTALFVANLIDSDKMCMVHAWYLCVDTQLFVIGLLYFFILFKNKRVAKVFLAVCLLVCFVTCGFIIYIESYPPTVIFTLTDRRFGADYMRKFFAMPYVYLGPYAIGLFLGTYMARVKAPPNIPTVVCVMGWIAAISLGLTSVYAVYPWNRGVAFSTLEAVTYGSLHRTTWTISVAWVVLACYAGKGGVVASILSWKGYQPLVRLSYLVYLIHPYVAFHYDLGREGTLDADNSTAVYYFCGIAVITHVICVPLHIIYEAPISRLENAFRMRSLARKLRLKSVNNHTARENVFKVAEKYKINNEMNVATKSIKIDAEK